MRILLIEDDPGETRLIEEMLSAVTTGRFDIQVADRLAAGLEQLTRQECDVVLLDLSLPDGQGLQALAQVRAASPHTPVIVLASLDDEEAGVEALRMGAQDYLVKEQLTASDLARTITKAIVWQQVENARRASEQHLLRTLIDHMPDFIYAKDRECRFVLANAACARYMGVASPD